MEFTIYAVKDLDTGKITNRLTTPKHFFWFRKKDAQNAVDRYEQFVKGTNLKVITLQVKEIDGLD